MDRAQDGEEKETTSQPIFSPQLKTGTKRYLNTVFNSGVCVVSRLHFALSIYHLSNWNNTHHVACESAALSRLKNDDGSFTHQG